MMRSTPRAQTIKKNAHRNLRFGWWSLLVFLSLGGALETLHGFKIGWFVDVGNETRRLMFTLAQEHGTLLALITIAAGLTARKVDRFELRPSVSLALIWAAILLPAGFFLGGIVIYYGDPRLRVWLLALGGDLLLFHVRPLSLGPPKPYARSGHPH